MNTKLIFIYISFVLFNLIIVESIRHGDNNSFIEDYDYVNETIDLIDSECEVLTVLDRFEAQHESGRNDPLFKKVKSIDETIDILKNLGNSFNSLFGLSKRDKHKLLEFISENDLGLSTECSSAYYRIYEALNNFDAWALKFVDSIGSFPPSGFAEGVFADFGDFDECLAVQSPGDQSYPTIEGKYCISKLNVPFPPMEWNEAIEEPEDKIVDLGIQFDQANIISEMTQNNMIKMLNIVNGSVFQMGICIPSVCRPNEVQNMLNTIFYPVLRMPIEVQSECQTKEQEIILDNYQKVSITILSILVISVIFSTTLDIFDGNMFEKPSKSLQFIHCFSMIENTKALFTTGNKFQALDTMRLLLILNVHVVHSYLFTPSLGVKTAKRMLTFVVPRVFNDWRYFWVKSPLMVDALFTLSGFLISYSLMRKLHYTKGRFNYVLYLFQNWARFAVIVFGSVLFYFVFPLFNSGPIWDTATDLLTTGCRNPSNLIKIFFFINNFQEFDIIRFNESCNVTLWFMSSLYQFIIISPIFVIIYYKRPRIGIIALTALLIITLLTTISPFLLFGIKPWMQRLSNGSSFLTSRLNDSINWFHTTPNNHAFSYFVGFSFGLLVNKTVLLNQFRVRLFWILSITGIIIAYSWNESFWHLRDTEPQTSCLLWHSLGKIIYSMSFGWIYFSCCTGRAGVFNRILSWKGFRPITRLSFGIYLLHYMIVIRRIFITKQVTFINDRMMIANLTIDFIFDVLIAYVFYIILECPFSNMFQIVFSRRPVKTIAFSEEDNDNQNKPNKALTD